MAHQSLASTSTTATPNSDYPCDIFINHRGPDVKKTFASHLYRRFVSRGYRVFLDQEELREEGKSASQTTRAIASASVHVAIFSPTYADSALCLNELVQMLESGAPIIPVFYHVKPSELLWTQGEKSPKNSPLESSSGVYGKVLRSLLWWIRGGAGVYAKALCNLKRKRSFDASTIEKWGEALSRVANISGFELEACNGDEGDLVDKVVQCVVRKTSLPVATYPTGLYKLLEEFERTVLQRQQPPGEAKVVGIVGLGGIGKTTLAKEFFKRRRSDYDRSSFLFDVRDASLTDLQNNLVKDLIPLDQKIDNIADGTGKLSHYLDGCQALIVLDDVDNVEQLDALFSPVKSALRCDSLILLTSRDKNILSGMEESSIYELRGLNAELSQELFCWHAFHQPWPVVGFEEMVGAFSSECMGLPLSLKVFGALLYGKDDLKYWKDQFCKISKVPDIQSRLKISYDSLDRQDKHDQFCKISKVPDIQSRLKISYDSLDRQDKHIFLDIACFFLGKDRDTAIKIWEGSGWEGSLGLVNLEKKCLIEIDYKNRLRMHDHLRDLGRYLADKEPPGCPRRLWRPPGNLSHNVFPESFVRGIRISEQISGQFVRFSNLSVDMYGLQLVSAEGDCLGSISNMVKQSDLTWLRWDRCPYPSLPPWIPLRNLRVLEVAGDQLETLWKDASEAPLQLRELYIGTLLRFPRSIGQLKHLEKIVLRGIIPELPEEFFNLRSLKHLKLSTGMECLPDSLGDLTNLRHIDLSHSMDLQMLPPSFGNLTELQHINLNGCLRLQRLPNSFGNLSRLEHLCLTGCSGLTLSSEHLDISAVLKALDFSLRRKIEVLPPAVPGRNKFVNQNVEGIVE